MDTIAESRSDLWRSLGGAPAEVRQLLDYAQSEFDLSRLPASFPLPDEPFVQTWEAYVEEAQRAGVFPCLQDRLVQLRFPVAAGMSDTNAYRAATRRGAAPSPGAPGLELRQPSELRLFLTDTPAGRIPVIVAAVRDDFVALVRALGHRNEPWQIPGSVGASIIGGYNNWDRIASLRRAWEANHTASGAPVEWAARWREIVREPGLYQDRFIVLSTGTYSGASAAEVGLGEAEWSQRSIALRLEHECTHYFTRRVLGSMRNRLADELIADYMGIVGALGCFRADWLLRFMGLERYPRYRPGGRLEEYRGTPPLDDGSFRVLGTAVERCARNLEAIDRLRTRRGGSWGLAAKAETIIALAAIGLEGMAGQSATELFQLAWERHHQRDTGTEPDSHADAIP